MVKNLVLSGGSMKGLAYIGMIKCIEEYDIVKKIDNFVGTSIGACVCFCLIPRSQSKAQTLLYLVYSALRSALQNSLSVLKIVPEHVIG